MSGRCKTIKKQIVDQDKVTEGIQNLRNKIYIGQGTQIHDESVEFAKSIEYSYGSEEDDSIKRPKYVAKPYKIKVMNMDNFPKGLTKLKNFLIASRDIDEEEVNSAIITIYPPPKQESSYETKIDPAIVLTSDRFIYLANCEEYLTYKMSNPERLGELSGFKTSGKEMGSVFEHMNRGNAYHFENEYAVAWNLSFNDLPTFVIPATKKIGGSRPKMIEKRVKSRYIIVIDLMMKSSKFKSNIKDAVSNFEEIGNNNKNPKINNIINKAKAKIDEIESDDEDVDETIISNIDFNLTNNVDKITEEITEEPKITEETVICGETYNIDNYINEITKHENEKEIIDNSDAQTVIL